MFSSFSFNVQKEILLSKFTGSEISLLVAINNVVTTFALLNHRPFPEITTQSILKYFFIQLSWKKDGMRRIFLFMHWLPMKTDM